jgi:hypothetical protein
MDPPKQVPCDQWVNRVPVQPGITVIQGASGLQGAAEAIPGCAWRSHAHDHQEPHGRSRVSALVSDTGR